MAGVFFGLLVGLELKHYVADYGAQPAWMLAGKGDVLHPGGYAHAALHAGLTLCVLLLFGTPVALAAALGAAEFVLHYGLDYAKAHYAAGIDMTRRPRRFWALHGLDQLAHQLTYAALIFIVLSARGLL
jgi:hypothetical protein